MKNIGIIGAMDEEVAILQKEMKEVHLVKSASLTFYCGKLLNKNVVIVRCGIGKVNASLCTQLLIDKFNVGYIINTGIAGSLDSDIDIGDIVVSTDLVFHDVDARAFGYPLGQIPRLPQFSFKADQNLIELAKKVCKEVNPDIKTVEGRILTGDQFVASKELKDKLVEEFNGKATEMEGGAIGMVATLNNVPFVVLRAISDKADNSATLDYPTFERQAIAHCVALTKGIVNELSEG